MLLSPSSPASPATPSTPLSFNNSLGRAIYIPGSCSPTMSLTDLQHSAAHMHNALASAAFPRIKSMENSPIHMRSDIANDEKLAKALQQASCDDQSIMITAAEGVKKRRRTAASMVTYSTSVKRQRVQTIPKDFRLDDLQDDLRREANEMLAMFDQEQLTVSSRLRHIVEPRGTRHDEVFVAANLKALEDGVVGLPDTVRRRGMQRMVQLLHRAKQASEDDGPWLTPEQFEAKSYDRPVFLTGQQPMPLWSVEQALAEFYDDNAEVFVQDCSIVDASSSTVERTISELKTRLRDNIDPTYPWNCLELAAVVEDGTRPMFLNGEDFRLLTKIKVPSTELHNAAPQVCRRSLHVGYKEAEKWMLLAQAGALTMPHQDSHGYSTYITVNDGILGYGWLHEPSKEQRLRWVSNPHTFINGDWRYRVLRPGDTVYFPAGTIHFVFRHPELGHTFAFGGHILRCSTIVPWLKAIKEERSSKGEITNEDMTFSAYTFIQQVTAYVQQALARGDETSLQRWGGRESIMEFLEIKETMIPSNLKAAAKAKRVRKS